jgi:predicted AAA+ superfamily ATPase
LENKEYVFEMDFGLDALPDEPGLIVVRGPRQYGKSTWLEQQLKATITDHGPGAAYYLNGDEIPTADALMASLREIALAFDSAQRIRRVFIDEITAIDDWHRGLKRLIDAGELRDILVVTTGSRARDLRAGTERLPGRKGRLDRTSYYFAPLSYAEFKRVCGDRLKESTLPSYILSGGSPVACHELAEHGQVPEYVAEIVRDWILGECAARGRGRASLLAVLRTLFRFGGTPVGQAKLAREAGLANNSVAAGYIEILADLMCVAEAHAWDAERRVQLRRKPCKLHFVNLLAALSWDMSSPRSPEAFNGMAPESQGSWLEWLVAQEVRRRQNIAGGLDTEMMSFWQGKSREVDFVVGDDLFIEVKRGQVTPLDYAWFGTVFPKARLIVVNQRQFQTDRVTGMTVEQFLSAKAW